MIEEEVSQHQPEPKIIKGRAKKHICVYSPSGKCYQCNKNIKRKKVK